MDVVRRGEREKSVGHMEISSEKGIGKRLLLASPTVTEMSVEVAFVPIRLHTIRLKNRLHHSFLLSRVRSTSRLTIMKQSSWEARVEAGHSCWAPWLRRIFSASRFSYRR